MENYESFTDLALFLSGSFFSFSLAYYDEDSCDSSLHDYYFSSESCDDLSYKVVSMKILIKNMGQINFTTKDSLTLLIQTPKTIGIESAYLQNSNSTTDFFLDTDSKTELTMGASYTSKYFIYSIGMPEVESYETVTLSLIGKILSQVDQTSSIVMNFKEINSELSGFSCKLFL
jgi:hypothetical protein